MEEKQFNQILETYSNLVFRIAYSYCKNREDAEDIYQNVFLKLFGYSKVFKDEEHMKRWLIRVTVNECHTLYLSPWKKRRQDCQDMDVLLEEQRAKEAYWQEEPWAEDSEVKELLMGLSKKYSTVLYLYYYEEYSTKEIANILKKTESTIRTRLMRGKEQLKERIVCLHQEEERTMKGGKENGRKGILC